MSEPVKLPKSPVIFIVDDEPINLKFLERVFEDKDYVIRTFQNGNLAVEAALQNPPDLVLLDIMMPEINGFEVCERLKSEPTLVDIPVMFITGLYDLKDKEKAFRLGVVDYITKPFQLKEILIRVETHLKIHRLKTDVDRQNRELQHQVEAKVQEISNSQIATIIAMAKLAEIRDDETGTHIFRVQRYCKALAHRLAKEPEFKSLLTEDFIRNLYHAGALHDIGKVGLPDSVLLKPGSLTAEERKLMQEHTVIGARTLGVVAASYPNNTFIRMGMEVARSHHERWDGTGYPDNLIGETIPLSARITAIADQYDALRNKRIYKPAFDEKKTLSIMLEGDGRTMPSHFDPRVLEAFRSIIKEFNDIHNETQLG